MLNRYKHSGDKVMRVKNIRKLWEEHYGMSLDGYELHHIVPIHMGGTNDISNLERVTVEEHKQKHLHLFELYGNFRDLCAYYLLCGRYSEAQKLAASNGGKIGGKRTYDNRLGLFNPDYDRLLWAKLGGKSGAKVQMEKKIGIHAQTPEERREFALMGLKKQLDNGTNVFLDSKRQSEFGKRGGIKNKGFVWINDGVNSIKYTKRQQEEIPIDIFLEANPEFKLGKICKRVECPHCKKVGLPGAMHLHHFNNCKHRNKENEDKINTENE